MEHTLISTIKKNAEAAMAAGHPAAAEVYLATIKPLRPFLTVFAGVDDVPLTAVISTGFTDAFRKFLQEDYEAAIDRRKATASTVKRHMENLRAVCRTAINALQLPNLAIFPKDDDSVDTEVKMLHGRALKEFRDIINEFARTSHLASSHPDHTESRRNFTRARTLARLILGTLSNGNGLDGPWIGKDEAPDNIKGLIINYATPISDMEMARRNTSILLTNLDIDPEPWLNHNRAAWLQLALDLGVAAREVRRAASILPDPGADEARMKLTQTVIPVFNLDVKTWFAIKSIGINGEELGAKIKSVGQADMFVPKDIHAREQHGRVIQYNNPVIDNLLFIHAGMAQARRVQSEVRTEGAFYGIRNNKGVKVFSPIPDTQMRNFMAFLGAAGSNVIALDPEKEYRGKRVRITGGRFAGCEGTIETVQIDYGKEGLSRNIRCFAVRFEWACIYGTVDFDPHFVEEIE